MATIAMSSVIPSESVRSPDHALATETADSIEGLSRWSLDPDEILSAYPMTRTSMILVVKLFRESCAERIEWIRQALGRDDPAQISRHLHALKGSLGMFASVYTLEVVAKLELQAKQGRLVEAGDSLKRLQSAIEGLQSTLNQLINE